MDTLHIVNDEEYLDNPVNDIEYQKMIEMMDGCDEKVDVYCDLFGDNGKWDCDYAKCPLRRAFLIAIRKQLYPKNEQ